MTNSRITTHVLDVARGTPAAAVDVVLEFSPDGKKWKELARGATNSDGRLMDITNDRTPLNSGMYRLTFHTAPYFRSIAVEGFYPYISVVFEVQDPGSHYHVPLLLSPFGYTTYRGS